MTATQPPRPGPLLVVDDEEATARGIGQTLRSQGFEEVAVAGSGTEALDWLERRPAALMILDLIMPGMRGEEVLRRALRLQPDLAVVVLTADTEVSSAVRCMKLGALDYLQKPVAPEALVAAVDKAIEDTAIRFECQRLREQFFAEELRQPDAFRAMITADPAMFRVFAYLESISRASHSVLIEGETGTGKELVARALHTASGRPGPFVAVNAAGLDDTLFTDTLFGHVAGAFTGADREREGRIAQATRGTLFLDEIGDLAEESQVKLLRVLQEREFFPLGSDRPRRLRARIVAATHQDPRRLRPDLYYRLRAYHVRVPALRERLGDLPLLLDRFLQAACRDLGMRRPRVPADLFAYLQNYAFPGNVRELESMVFDAVAQCRHGVLPLRPFLARIGLEGARPRDDAPPGSISFPFPMPSLGEIETAAVTEALDRVQGNRSAAARLLGVSRPTIARHLKDAARREDATGGAAENEARGG